MNVESQRFFETKTVSFESFSGYLHNIKGNALNTNWSLKNVCSKSGKKEKLFYKRSKNPSR